MKNNYGILFNRKSGKVFKIMEGLMSSLMKMWALNGNVSASRDFVVFDEDGIILAYYEGKKNDMPKIRKEMEGKNINEFFEGALEMVINA